jgi:hypothetical protein
MNTYVCIYEYTYMYVYMNLHICKYEFIYEHIYKFSKMLCCIFSWCSTILLKSFIYLFICLFIIQGLVVSKASAKLNSLQ